MSDQTKPQDEQPKNDSLMSDEELESVSGGCQIGDTMGPKFTSTIIDNPFPPTLPTDPYTFN